MFCVSLISFSCFVEFVPSSTSPISSPRYTATQIGWDSSHTYCYFDPAFWKSEDGQNRSLGLHCCDWRICNSRIFFPRNFGGFLTSAIWEISYQTDLHISYRNLEIYFITCLKITNCPTYMELWDQILSEKIYSARIRSHCESSAVGRFIREEFHSSDVKTTTILTIYNFTKQVKPKRRPNLPLPSPSLVQISLTPSFPVWINIHCTVRTHVCRIQCVRGGGVWGSGPQTDKHLPQSQFTGQCF